LAAAGVEPVTVSRPDYVFESRSAVLDALKARLALDI
jgi:ATP phosphoribosyltransferase